MIDHSLLPNPFQSVGLARSAPPPCSPESPAEQSSSAPEYSPATLARVILAIEADLRAFVDDLNEAETLPLFLKSEFLGGSRTQAGAAMGMRRRAPTFTGRSNND
jgi:hypothetical protein